MIVNIALEPLYIYKRSSTSDSAPVRGKAYKPAGLWTQQSQRRDVAQLRVGGRGGVGRNVVGGSEKFLYGMVRSRKPLLTVTPFIVDNCYASI